MGIKVQPQSKSCGPDGSACWRKEGIVKIKGSGKSKAKKICFVQLAVFLL